MPKTVRGTKDLRRQQMAAPVQSGSINVVYGTSDPRQLRCKKCGNLATNVPDGHGGKELRCTFCNTRYGSSTMTP